MSSYKAVDRAGFKIVAARLAARGAFKIVAARLAASGAFKIVAASIEAKSQISSSIEQTAQLASKD